MLKILIAFLLFIVSAQITQPQTVLVGIGLCPDILIFEKRTSAGLNFNLSLNVQLNRIFELEFRPGMAGNSSDFNGFEFISSLKIFPFQSGVDLIVGLKLHANAGGSGTSHQVRNGLFVLPQVGIGYKIKVQKTFVTFDITFQKPFPNDAYYHYSYLENKYYYTTSFNAVISLNIGFAWQLY